MLRELARHPEQGLLGAHSGLLFGGPAVVQYWRSFEHLERFARDPANLHLPAWRWFNRAVKASGEVGIWHETYLVPAGRYEAIYGNMARIGLAAAAGHVPIARRGQSAAHRSASGPPARVPLPLSPTPLLLWAPRALPPSFRLLLPPDTSPPPPPAAERHVVPGQGRFRPSDWVAGGWMLRLAGGQVESLFDELLPVEVRELPADLATLDRLLADPRLLAPIEQAWEQTARDHGRPTIPMASFVRLMVVKQRTGWGYATLIREVSDSLHLRRFCLLPLTQRVPEESTVQQAGPPARAPRSSPN